MSEVYENLAKHLDDLPGGFPATDSGVELRILKRLFTTQEAEVAQKLSMMPEPSSATARYGRVRSSPNAGKYVEKRFDF